MLKSYSYSAMAAYLKCGFAFKCRYIDNIPGKLTGNLIVGTAYHNAVGFGLAEQLVFKDLPPIERVLKCYNDTWENSVNRKFHDEDNRMVEHPEIDFGDETKEQNKAGGQIVVEKYYNEVMKTVKPREIEVWKRIELNGIPITSKVDVITTDNKIIDHKTSSKLSSEFDLAKEFQSSFYAITCGMDELDFELHQAVIKKESEIKIWPIHRSKADINWVKDQIRLSWAAIQTGIFLPTGVNGWWCGPKQCVYWDICHALPLKTYGGAPDDF